MCVQAIAGVTQGHFGRHTAWVAINEPADIMIWAKFTYAAEIMATPIAITFAKLSILAFFRRLFPVRTMNIATLAVGAFVAAYGIATLLVAIFQCRPVSKAWNLNTPGDCIQLMLWSQAVSIPNIVSDVVLIALPLQQVWKLQTGIAQKIGLSIAFGLGGFNIVCSALRMSMFFTQYTGSDPYMAAVSLHSWSVVEATTAVIAACVPSLYPFFKRAAARHSSKCSKIPTSKTRSDTSDHSVQTSGWQWPRSLQSLFSRASQRTSTADTVVEAPARPASLKATDRDDQWRCESEKSPEATLPPVRDVPEDELPLQRN